MKSNIIDIEVQFQTQTPSAVCVRAYEGSADIWIPKSRCEIDPEDPNRGQVITLTTDQATAEEKELV